MLISNSALLHDLASSTWLRKPQSLVRALEPISQYATTFTITTHFPETPRIQHTFLKKESLVEPD